MIVDVEDSSGLGVWLKGKPPAFAYVLAARAALRVVPVLESALHADKEERRHTIILPSFRALAAVNFACACPRRRAEIRDIARRAGRCAFETTRDLASSAHINALEAKDVMPELPDYYVQFEQDDYALGIAAQAVTTVMHAVQALVDAVDAERGIASSDSVYEAAVAAAVAAHHTVDRIRGNTELFNALEDKDESKTDVAEHITEFWRSVRLDAKYLETNTKAMSQPQDVVSNLTGRALWLEGTSVWAGRQWAEFKDELPTNEGWNVWIDWYEARLMGRGINVDREFDWLNIPEDDWRKGSSHVNAIIEKWIADQADSLVASVSIGFEELDEVRQVTTIDLSMYKDRIRHALSNDPYHAIGATKDMLEATMKTILHRRRVKVKDNVRFSELTTQCLSELGLIGTSDSKTEGERHLRRIASSAKKMIETANKLRNRAGTGHGRVVGDEPIVTRADAGLVATTGLVLAAWMLRHDADT